MVDFVESRLLPKPAKIDNKVDCCQYGRLCCRFWQQIGNNVNSTVHRGRLCCQYGQLCCRFWQQIGNNVNSTVHRGRLCCRYVQLCCRYGRLCCQCTERNQHGRLCRLSTESIQLCRQCVPGLTLRLTVFEIFAVKWQKWSTRALF